VDRLVVHDQGFPGWRRARRSARSFPRPVWPGSSASSPGDAQLRSTRPTSLVLDRAPVAVRHLATPRRQYSVMPFFVLQSVTSSTWWGSARGQPLERGGRLMRLLVVAGSPPGSPLLRPAPPPPATRAGVGFAAAVGGRSPSADVWPSAVESSSKRRAGGRRASRTQAVGRLATASHSDGALAGLLSLPAVIAISGLARPTAHRRCSRVSFQLTAGNRYGLVSQRLRQDHPAEHPRRHRGGERGSVSLPPPAPRRPAPGALQQRQLPILEVVLRGHQGCGRRSGRRALSGGRGELRRQALRSPGG
jgi:hypothetical protein